MSDDLIYYPSDVLVTNINPPLVAGDEDDLDNDIQLTVATNYLVLAVTEDQYVRMLSALLNGAYRTYPADYIEIIYPLIKAGKVALCDAIQDCIDDTSSIQQSIAKYSLSAPFPQNQPEVTANLNALLVNTPAGCDNDIIFGMTTGYTDLMNAISEDILQIFVDASSASGRIGDLIEAIPIIGEAPLDDLFQFVESFMVDLNDAYAAAYTTQLRDDIRCDLFCLALPGCDLKLSDARDYFFDKLGESISISLWNGFLDDIIDIAYSGTDAVWAMHLLITQTIIFGGELVGFDVNRLTATIQSLYNDPDSDWDGLCDDCDWGYILDFEAIGSLPAWVNLDNCSWVEGTGITDDDTDDPVQNYMGVEVDVDSTTWQDVIVHFAKVLGSFSAGATNDTIYHTSNAPGNRDDESDSETNTSPYEVENIATVDTIVGTTLTCAYSVAGSRGSMVITKMEFTGTGTIPSEFT